MYKSCGQDGIVGEKIGKKGVLLARRDNSVFIRKIYEKVISKIFNNEDRDDILYFIIQKLNDLFSRNIDDKDFIITKSVGDTANFENKETETQYLVKFKNEKGVIKGRIGSYTVPLLPDDEKERIKQFKKKNVNNTKDYYLKSLPAQVQLALKMRRRGSRIDAGSRIEFVIIQNTDTDGHKGKLFDKIESYDYYKLYNNILKIDYFYYLEALINPLDEVLNIAYNKNNNYKYKFQTNFIDWQYNFRYKIRNKVINDINNLFSPKIIFKNN